MKVEISVVICTHNRAGYLTKALQSLSAQSLNPDSYEVIVVDNGSTDNTREVYENIIGKTNWIYVHDPVIGLSHARNTGWGDAKGKFIAFMDDDAIADPNWLERYLAAFQKTNPRLGCVGGRCLPIWEAPRPHWLSDEMLRAFSIFHYGETSVVLNQKQFLTGCNIAFPRTVLHLSSGFREDLGRLGSNLLSNEDLDMRQQLDHLGLVSVYDPGIIVHHHIPTPRLTKKWFCERSYWQGVSLARMQHAGRQFSLIGKTGVILKKSSWGLLRAGAMMISFDGKKRFMRELQLFETLGYLYGMVGIKPARERLIEATS